MSRIKTYEAYTETVNGLFVDIPDFNKVPFIIGTTSEGDYIAGIDPIEARPLTAEDIRQAIQNILVGSRQQDSQIVAHTGRSGMREFQQAIEQETYRQMPDMNSVVNMSEEETIQYLDRISQEQENEQHNSTI